jgi:hypothetical protein
VEQVLPLWIKVRHITRVHRIIFTPRRNLLADAQTHARSRRPQTRPTLGQAGRASGSMPLCCYYSETKLTYPKEQGTNDYYCFLVLLYYHDHPRTIEEDEDERGRQTKQQEREMFCFLF